MTDTEIRLLHTLVCAPPFDLLVFYVFRDISAQMVLENFSFSFGKTARILSIKKGGCLPSFFSL